VHLEFPVLGRSIRSVEGGSQAHIRLGEAQPEHVGFDAETDPQLRDRQPWKAAGTRLIGQANNVFIFPGLGLGAIGAGAREITDAMFLVAATTLAELTSDERLAQGALYPRLAELRSISRAIAVAVAREARESGVAATPIGDIEAAVDAAMWSPDYLGQVISSGQ
jgi:malic enzyme